MEVKGRHRVSREKNWERPKVFKGKKRGTCGSGHKDLLSSRGRGRRKSGRTFLK